MKKLKILLNGLIKENPSLVLVLGTCPTIAMSTSVKNGVGMGLAATFVLMGSNVVISLLRRAIPDKVRIPCYIVVISCFVTIVQMLCQAYFPDIYSALGIFLPLIVVNCIILGRAEMFANKNSVLDSLLDGAGMGLGFTLALFAMGTIREVLGSGSWLGIKFGVQNPMSIMTLAPGGFFVFACMIALVNKLNNGLTFRNIKNRKCSGNCGACMGCAKAEEGGEAK